MEQAVEEGKICSIGLSNWYVEELTEFLPQVTITPALVQNEIHPYYQENDVIPLSRKGDRCAGLVSLRRTEAHGGTARGRSDLEIAEVHGVTSAQVILRWNLQKGVVGDPRFRQSEHIRENIALFDFELSAEEMKRIAALDKREKHDWY